LCEAGQAGFIESYAWKWEGQVCFSYSFRSEKPLFDKESAVLNTACNLPVSNPYATLDRWDGNRLGPSINHHGQKKQGMLHGTGGGGAFWFV
jgi:hypothetical protein